MSAQKAADAANIRLDKTWKAIVEADELADLQEAVKELMAYGQEE